MQLLNPESLIGNNMMKDYRTDVKICELGAIVCAFFSGGIPGAICVISFLMYMNMNWFRKLSLFTFYILLPIHTLSIYLSLGLSGAILAIVIIPYYIFDHNKVSESSDHVVTEDQTGSSSVTPQQRRRHLDFGYIVDTNLRALTEKMYYNTSLSPNDCQKIVNQGMDFSMFQEYLESVKQEGMDYDFDMVKAFNSTTMESLDGKNQHNIHTWKAKILKWSNRHLIDALMEDCTTYK